jgi:hypothetical protein
MSVVHGLLSVTSVERGLQRSDEEGRFMAQYEPGFYSCRLQAEFSFLQRLALL